MLISQIFSSISHKGWDDFFEPSIDYTMYSNTHQKLDANGDKSYYISFCYFISLDVEGAISIKDETYNNVKFLIDTSSFDKCGYHGPSGGTGSLCVNSENGECVQDRICSFGSKSIFAGVYCSIKLSQTSVLKNYLIDSTISSSSSNTYQGNGNIHLLYGETNMKSINISNSKLNSLSSYDISCRINSSVSLSTFSNNTSSGKEISYFGNYNGNFNFTISYCNYNDIKCDIFIWVNIYLYIINCSIYNNIINDLYFFQDNYQQFILVKGCYFDVSDPYTDGLVTITEGVDSTYPKNLHFPSSCSTESKPEVEITEPIQYQRHFKKIQRAQFLNVFENIWMSYLYR